MAKHSWRPCDLAIDTYRMGDRAHGKSNLKKDRPPDDPKKEGNPAAKNTA
jgi:hypothetical protein